MVCQDTKTEGYKHTARHGGEGQDKSAEIGKFETVSCTAIVNTLQYNQHDKMLVFYYCTGSIAVEPQLKFKTADMHYSNW